MGRGLRLSPGTGKEDCHIIDIVDNVARSNGMLVSPTLWGLTHDELEDREAVDLNPATGQMNADGLMGINAGDGGLMNGQGKLKTGSVTFIDQGDPFQLHREFQPLSTISSNAWVSVSRIHAPFLVQATR